MQNEFFNAITESARRRIPGFKYALIPGKLGLSLVADKKSTISIRNGTFLYL